MSAERISSHIDPAWVKLSRSVKDQSDAVKASRGRNSHCRSSTQDFQFVQIQPTTPGQRGGRFFFFSPGSVTRPQWCPHTHTHKHTWLDAAINITSTHLQYWQHKDIMLQLGTAKTKSGEYHLKAKLLRFSLSIALPQIRSPIFPVCNVIYQAFR